MRGRRCQESPCPSVNPEITPAHIVAQDEHDVRPRLCAPCRLLLADQRSESTAHSSQAAPDRHHLMWASRASKEHEINFPHGPAVHPAGRAAGRSTRSLPSALPPGQSGRDTGPGAAQTAADQAGWRRRRIEVTSWRSSSAWRRSPDTIRTRS